MILGVGTDLCEIARIGRAIENNRFFERIYTPVERAYLNALGSERRAESAAGLFAAKEAIAKALGTGMTGFGFADIEIVKDALGCPHAQLYNGAAARVNTLGARVHASISHDAGLALAFAVLERE